MSFLLALALLVSPAGLSPVRFAPRAGWHAGAGRVHACPGVPAARCGQAASWTATVRWRDCADCILRRTLAVLPRQGIAVQIILGAEHPSRAPAGRWPPRLRRRDVQAGMEGIPNRFGIYQRLLRVGRYEPYVWVFFGRAHPTAAQLATANAVLAAASLPR
jgi:hypothetical protein